MLIEVKVRRLTGRAVSQAAAEVQPRDLAQPDYCSKIWLPIALGATASSWAESTVSG